MNIQVIGKKKFNPQTFNKVLEESSGIFTIENHPEWRTKRDIIGWLRQTRQMSERTILDE